MNKSSSHLSFFFPLSKKNLYASRFRRLFAALCCSLCSFTGLPLDVTSFLTQKKTQQKLPSVEIPPNKDLNR